MSLSHCIHQTLNSKASTRSHSRGIQQSCTLILNTFLFGVIILIANILKRAFSSQLAAKLRNRLLVDRKSGSTGMPRPISYAVFCLKKKKNNHIITHTDVQPLFDNPRHDLESAK